MKLWRLLLAIYVLVLSGLSCEAFCLEESTNETELASLPFSDDDAHDESCLPFCLCATCPGFTVPQPPELMEVLMPVTPILAAALPCYQTPHAFDVPGRIWQPPRLG